MMNEDLEELALFESFRDVAPSEESSQRAIEKVRNALMKTLQEPAALLPVSNKARPLSRWIGVASVAAALLVAVTVVFMLVMKVFRPMANPQQQAIALVDGGSSMTLPDKSLSNAAKAIPFLHPLIAENATVMVANGGDAPLALGSRVTTTDNDGKLHVWNWSQGKMSRILPGSEYWGTDLAITPDGRKLLFQYKQIIDLANGNIKLIDLGEPTIEIGGATYGRLGGMRFSPNGSRLAVVVTEMDRSTPGRIEREFMRVFEFPSGKVLCDMPLGESYELRVAFSGDGKHIAIGSADHEVTLRETDTGKVVRTFAPKLASQLISLAVSPDGKYVAASDREPGDLYIWEMAEGKLLHTIKGEEFAKGGATGHAHGALRFSPDGRFLADGRWNATFVIDVAKGSIEAAAKDGFPSQVQWSADGTTIMIIGSVVIHEPVDGRGKDNSYPSVRHWKWRPGLLQSLSEYFF